MKPNNTACFIKNEIKSLLEIKVPLIDIQITCKLEKSNITILVNNQEYSCKVNYVDKIQIDEEFDGVLKHLFYAETTEIIPFDKPETVNNVLTDIEKINQGDGYHLKNVENRLLKIISKRNEIDGNKGDYVKVMSNDEFNFNKERDYFNKVVHPIHKLLKYKARKGVIVDSLTPLKLGNLTKQNFVIFKDVLEIK